MAITRPERYAVLLRVRKRREDIRARDFAVARDRTSRARNDRAAIERHQRDILAEADEAARTTVDPLHLRHLLQFERHLAKRAVAKDAEIRSLKTDEDQKRRALETAAKERRIVDKLIERARDRMQAEARRLEQRQSDEIASVRAALQRRRLASERRAP